MQKFLTEAGVVVLSIAIIAIYCIMAGVLLGAVIVAMGFDYFRRRFRSHKVGVS
jgi:hypothetical protein